MKMFSDCSGPCGCCSAGSACCAGHGDDDFSPASASQIITRLNKGEYNCDRDYMIKQLKEKHNIDYVPGMLPNLEETYGQAEALTFDDKITMTPEQMENLKAGFLRSPEVPMLCIRDNDGTEHTYKLSDVIDALMELLKNVPEVK